MNKYEEFWKNLSLKESRLYLSYAPQAVSNWIEDSNHSNRMFRFNVQNELEIVEIYRLAQDRKNDLWYYSCQGELRGPVVGQKEAQKHCEKFLQENNFIFE